MLEEPESQPQTRPNPQQEPPPQPPDDDDEEEVEAVEEPRDMAVSSTPPPVPDVEVPQIPAPNPPPPSSRKPLGKMKKPLTGKQRAAVKENLRLLNQNLHPVPFAPGKTLDLSKHEPLFRALGLWDFAHLEFDREIRSDLLTLLIANYDQPNRRSFVNKVRISVSRADLARALLLPSKKEKANILESWDSELFSAEESVAVIMDFMSNYMLFLEDACILTVEVVAAIQLVKEGKPHKVDWAGLIWNMVEKEILDAPKSGLCYYASHLHCLMKYQKPRLFEEEARPELVPERALEVALVEEEEDSDNGGAVRIRSLENFMDMDSEKHVEGSSMGLGGHGDAKECKEEEQEQWLSDGENDCVDRGLRPCSLSDVRGTEFENLSNGGECQGRVEENYNDDLASKFSSLERLASTDLLQAMDISYSSQVHSVDPCSGEFLAARADTHKSMSLDPGPGGSLLFTNNVGKREVGEIDDDNDQDGAHHFSQRNHQKRMRSDGHWEHTQSDFDTCMEQVQCWMGKAKVITVEKEQACMDAQLNLQFLTGVLHEKDHIIQSLEKTRMEELHKTQLENSRFEHELSVMTRLVRGYQKALKDTRCAFAEYRKCFPQGNEPLYRDVGGTGGVVLSTRDLERPRLEKEEELRRVAIEIINDFSKDWYVKFDGYAEWLMNSARRLVELDSEVKLLKQRFAETKVSDT